MSLPELRLRAVNDRPLRSDGQFVLYWMVANRRTTWNFSFERAIELARELKKPLVVLEALRVGYRWASDRLHAFVVQGMADNERALAKTPVLYYPYLEPEPNAGHGLLTALAKHACAVVTDDFPCFFLPRMIALVGRQIDVRLEAVDSNGILPMRAAPQLFTRAFSFRRYLQKSLRPHLEALPQANPLARVKLPTMTELPARITRQWPSADVAALAKDLALLRQFPIDHTVGLASMTGGAQ
ncbi:MAG TPA: deoxyribodipyrimidine photolyase, partial [Pirellulaceae bacterium]|nr:deoxyribodipyrimidine photolyase [Pirellulaceae bacterium]